MTHECAGFIGKRRAADCARVACKPTIASLGYTITPEKQDMDLKSLLKMMMEDFKKEIQENS